MGRGVQEGMGDDKGGIGNEPRKWVNLYPHNTDYIGL